MFTEFHGAGLAPMAGVTDAAMRLLCHEQGAAWSVSEMLSAKGWVYSGGKNQAAKELITRLPGEGIAGLQLFGRDPEYMATAANELKNIGFQFIDINMGCPAPKITSAGEGSALMKEPRLAGEIVSAVVNAVSVPVSVKIRSGWDENSVNAVEIAKICEDNGARAITVHARTRNQYYSGKADRSVIRSVKRAVSVPVFGNGDIFSAGDYASMINETGCDAVMIGRGALGNPWIFSEIASVVSGSAAPVITPNMRVAMAKRHFDMETSLHGERRGLLEMRKHIAWYVHGLKGAAKFREIINTLETKDDVLSALEEFASSLIE